MPRRITWQGINEHLNFFRYHVILFTFVPIVAACIFYAANGTATGNANSPDVGIQKVLFIDSLFLCYSAMTVTGLVTVNLSAVHPFQQVILLVLFVCGDLTFVSYIMVLIRKRFIRVHCEEALRNTNSLKPSRTGTLLRRASTLPISGFRSNLRHRFKGGKINISGPTDGHAVSRVIEDNHPRTMTHPEDSPMSPPRRDSRLASFASQHDLGAAQLPTIGESTQGSSSVSDERKSSIQSPPPEQQDVHQNHHPGHIAFDSPSNAQYRDRQLLRERTRTMTMDRRRSMSMDRTRTTTMERHPTITLDRAMTTRLDSHNHIPFASPQNLGRMPKPIPLHIPRGDRNMNTGYGGFSYPPYLLSYLIPKRFRDKIWRTVSGHQERNTLLMHPTIAPEGISQGGRTVEVNPVVEDSFGAMVRAKVARWMPDGMEHLVIGRNSRFFTEELDRDAIDQLGGVEYRALRMLSYFLPLYIMLIQIIPFAIIAIYLTSVSDWDYVFQMQKGAQDVTVDKTWFSFYLTASAFSGCGMSLLDQSMVPLNHTYCVLYCLLFVIILGNHALPMMLRLLVWIACKMTREGSEMNQTLHFLLDHPRRCYLYLFPSQQTWYLTFVFVAFMGVEIFGYLVLDIGLSVLEMSPFQRFSDSFFQSASVRATGFAIIGISNLAPAVLFLYVILMYVAIYPIALSVRATNVYEERSLGVFEDHSDLKAENEPAFRGRKSEVFGKYLWWHMRRQLAFDIWPLAVAIFTIACFERGKLLDPNRSAYFDIFRIIFECTSAYSTIGLSMGTPNNNFSFAGEFGTCSKLVVILVMLRGRHRGLPLAIDRAIILPHEYQQIGKKDPAPASAQPGQNGSHGESNEPPDHTVQSQV
ncbi:cation transport protein-domain-containing protein [Kockovaella imperatae]|uniref:Cation transport protein-domain-containing protein n=1 Tax=Kockovaella imperatae TaxID=4999 RepID=A0A1Y1U7Z8_9TREE|nr:cation transport protein-domain-containing protein [Kockovaella imperatae]ORX34133.1 cation transport protein-domain-containing protein [Kockovaella imperatae]